MLTAIVCRPELVAVKLKTCSAPGVPQGPGGFHAPPPLKLKVPVLQQDNEVILLHGLEAGAPDTRVALKVIQLL